MTTVENQHVQVPPAPDDNDYYQDDAGFPASPQLEPRIINFKPSPTPPLAVPLPPVSPDSSPPGSPDRKSSYKPKVRPSLSDAVLIDYMGGFQHSDTARKAGNEPLASWAEEDSTMGGTHVQVNIEKDDDKENMEKDVREEEEEEVEEESVERNGVEKDDLSSVAARAMNVLKGNSPPTPTQAIPATKCAEPRSDTRRAEGDIMEDVKPTIPSITATLVGGARLHPSPDANVKTEVKAPGELPPIRHNSPHSVSNGNGGPITLPSITDQLGDISHIPEPLQTGNSPFAQSPQADPCNSLLFQATAHLQNHLNTGGNFHHQAVAAFILLGMVQGFIEGNLRQMAIRATPAIDRMSIDGITNPQIGGFHCTYPGCMAQPFQTQYLLNSHANVHSSNRPHYCSVKGCPRSEGGKGFKRKNEMIRHGLVHDSPGYVCPFCPDREHKYPRPDNLQRHVRVHHVDKDKDDAQLRDVLSQRPEGPSRGRRRRGGTS
ncbi:Metallothionein expression activator [Lachnellula willkommii]|uniref:Metallothionein expression activator n=1 Tax=Lachnellula willkommii TaxID=215461 RepID=A0A559M3C0_9HELO|nr:Metallothionein expression activator [Lachnellula willkommii]